MSSMFTSGVTVSSTNCAPRVATRWWRRTLLVGALLAVVLGAVGATGGAVAAQAPEEDEAAPLKPLEASSPQATYTSFLERIELVEELLITYQNHRTSDNQQIFTAGITKTAELFDLSEVAEANLDEVIGLSFASLADIINRLPPVDIDEIPDEDDVEVESAELTLPGSDVPLLEAAGGAASWTVPDTEITIALVQDGPRAGSWAFSPDTISRLPSFREKVDDLPVNDGVRVRDWVQTEADFTGYLVPTSWVDAVPDWLDGDVLGSPVWKMLVDIALLAIVGLAGFLWHRLVTRRADGNSVRGRLWRLTTPLLLIMLVNVTRAFMNNQINHSGDLAIVVNTFVTAATWTLFAWAFWVAVQLVVEWLVESPRFTPKGVDASLVRLLGRVATVVGAVVIAIAGLSRIGISTVGLGIGAGVAGVAVALAATSTMENLIGGITIYADTPFSVGDLVTIADDHGWVETIGPRSTTIRKLDDTLVVLPNSDISRAKITNFAERRKMLFLHVIGVRYETTVEQLELITGAIREQFRAHPMVIEEGSYPRIRVIEFGASSIDIEVRAFIDTDRLPVFLQVQQELLLLTYDIVEAAGTGFAFPSTTAYLADDTGLPPMQSDSELLVLPDVRPTPVGAAERDVAELDATDSADDGDAD